MFVIVLQVPKILYHHMNDIQSTYSRVLNIILMCTEYHTAVCSQISGRDFCTLTCQSLLVISNGL